jgi:hypothetical protein
MLVVVKPVLIFDCISIDEIQIGKSHLSSMNRWFHWRHMANTRQAMAGAALNESSMMAQPVPAITPATLTGSVLSLMASIQHRII